MKIRSIVFLFFLLPFLPSFGQKADNVPLFTYGNDTVYQEEFVRVFLKNNRKEEQNDSSLKAYLNLYVNFKLKVKEAREMKLDEVETYQTELNGYRAQLAKSYMVDTSLTSQLIDEAYERLKFEVKASHILVLCGPNALPKDTAAAWKKINDIRKRIMAGTAFDSLAYSLSEDISAKNNYGNLGYFSAFDMIYPFENMAFKTEVGSLSPIFRTDFGYHILKVVDKRVNRGERKLAHIMLQFEDPNNETAKTELKRKVDSIYAQLKGGAQWANLVTTFSDDKSSAKNNGELNWISGTARIAESFKDAAFALKNVGDISEPVLTPYGWHIIRLVDSRSLAPKEDMMDKLRLQVVREPERAKMSQGALVNKLIKENGLTINQVGKKFFLDKCLDSSMITAEYTADKAKNPQMALFTIGTKTYTISDFAQYIEQYQTPQIGASLSAAVNKMLQEFQNQSVLAYEESILEEKYPSFSNLMQEYREGILLFNLTEKVVWNKAIEDSTGLKAFYEQIKDNYQWPNRVSVNIYEATSKEAYKQTKKLLKNKKLNDIEVSQTINKDNPLSLVIKRAKLSKGESPYLEKIKWKEGVYDLKEQNGKWVIVRVNEVLPAGPKALNEIKGLITGEFQNQLEAEWIERLRAKYPVIVNEAAVTQLLK